MLTALIAPVTLAVAWLAEELGDESSPLIQGPRYGTPIDTWCPDCRGASCGRYGMLTIEGDEYSPDHPENPYRYWEHWDWIDEDEKEEVEGTASRILWSLTFARPGSGYKESLRLYFGDGWPWHDRIKWRPLMPIRAESWDPFDPFPRVQSIPKKMRRNNLVAIIRGDHPDSDRYSRRSPSGKWVYVRQILPFGRSLSCAYVTLDEDDYLEGTVYFTEDVAIPSIFEDGMSAPWMSMTPQEIITQQPGLQHARDVSRIAEWRGKAHVIVAGLGLGWLLCEVAKLPGIARVTLVEQDQELVDWLLPRLCPFLPENKPIDVVVGDAFEVMKPMKADLALMDIWPSLTDIGDDMDRLEDDCPGIKHWWGWGYR